MSNPERRPSLRLRIAASLATLALLVVLVQSLVMISLLGKREDAFIDQILNEQIGFSMSRWATSPESARPNAPDMWLYRIPPNEQPTDAGSEVPSMFSGLGRGSHEVFLGEREYHVVVRDSADGRFILAYDVDQHETRLSNLILFAVATAAGLGLLILVAGYLLAGRLTRRLDEMAVKVDFDAPGTFVEPGMERELLAVARALDDSRQRQQSMLARERAFASNLSHELRTPLSGIRSDAELLLTLPDLPDAVTRRGQRIILSADRINQLASSLLWLAREAKPAEIVPVVLVPAIESVWSDLQAVNPKPLTLRIDVSPQASLLTDPVLLDLVLRNLLENALRYSESGEIVCQLAGTRLVVRDTGPGFDEAELSRAFDRHFTGQRGVHGIGLALVQHICGASGWSASVANTSSGGAVSIDFGAAVRDA